MMMMTTTTTKTTTTTIINYNNNNNNDDDDDDDYGDYGDDDDDDNNNRTESTIPYFKNLHTRPRTISNTYAQVARAQSCSNHVQHIHRISRATCGVSRGKRL